MTFARFTPSILDEQTLEDLFVGRRPLLDEALRRIESAARGDERDPLLFVGPRGAGKTHLLSMIAHRARALPGYGSTFQLAWLPEDLWALGDVDDLIEEILRAIEPAPAEDVGVAPDRRLRACVETRGPVVVLIENLDNVLTAIGPQGERQLRALIDVDRCLVLIATTTALGERAARSESGRALYNIFTTIRLPPLTQAQGAKMLSRIATVSGDEGLAAWLETDDAQHRLAAIDHLAGGLPRIWALLAGGLSVGGVDQMIDALMMRVDDLTPYYVSRLHELSPQEQKVVLTLAAAPASLNVRQIAERSGIGEKSAARAVSGLRATGWLRPRTGPIVERADRRLTYYDLAEPLFRLVFQLRGAQQGHPVRALIEFLKFWFADDLVTVVDDDSTPTHLARATGEALSDPWVGIHRWMNAPGGAAALVDALVRPPPVSDSAAVADSLAALDDAIAAWQGGDPDPLLGLPWHITTLIDGCLAHDPAGHRTRLRLARMALDVAAPSAWSTRVERAMEQLDGAERAEAARIATVWRARVGDLVESAALLGQGMQGASAVDLLWLAVQLVRFEASVLALTVLDDLVTTDPMPDQVAVAGMVRELAASGPRPPGGTGRQ